MEFDASHEMDDLECLVTYDAPRFVHRRSLPESEYGSNAFEDTLMDAMRDGATEIRVSGRSQGLGRIVTITPESPPQEVLSPSVPALMQYLETIEGQTLFLNLEELIESFLRKAYPSNRLGEEYITHLRSATVKQFEVHIKSADAEKGQAVICLKPVM